MAKTRQKCVEEIKEKCQIYKYPIHEIKQAVRKYSPREEKKYLDIGM